MLNDHSNEKNVGGGDDYVCSQPEAAKNDAVQPQKFLHSILPIGFGWWLAPRSLARSLLLRSSRSSLLRGRRRGLGDDIDRNVPARSFRCSAVSLFASRCFRLFPQKRIYVPEVRSLDGGDMACTITLEGSERPFSFTANTRAIHSVASGMSPT